MAERWRLSDALKVAKEREAKPSAPEPPVNSHPVDSHPVGTSTPGNAERQPPAMRTVSTERGVDPHPVEQLTVAYKKGHLQLPNTVVFGLWPMLNNSDRLLYEELYIWTIGFNQNPRVISQARIMARLGWTDDRKIRKAMRSLEEKGLVKNRGMVSGGPREERGTVVEVFLPQTTSDSTPREFTPRKPTEGGMRNMKEDMKDHETGVFEVRTVAARIFELRRDEPGYTHEDLVRAVRDALAGQGRQASASTIEEATKGMFD